MRCATTVGDKCDRFDLKEQNMLAIELTPLQFLIELCGLFVAVFVIYVVWSNEV